MSARTAALLALRTALASEVSIGAAGPAAAARLLVERSRTPIQEPCKVTRISGPFDQENIAWDLYSVGSYVYSTPWISKGFRERHVPCRNATDGRASSSCAF